MIKIYRKTSTIKAEQFDGSDEMAKRYGAELYSESGYGYDAVEGEPNGDGYVLITPDGESLVRTGDWIATDINDKHLIIADEVFKKTYAELPIIPKEVSLSIEDWKKHYRGLDQIFGIVYQYEITRTQGNATINWIMCGNQDTFVRAWLDGYQVDK